MLSDKCEDFEAHQKILDGEKVSKFINESSRPPVRNLKVPYKS